MAVFMCSVRKLFHPLDYNLICLSKLNMTKLTNTKIKWIIRNKKKGLDNKTIADSMNVTIRRIQQINKEYLLTGNMPELTKSRRPKKLISIRWVEWRALKRFGMNYDGSAEHVFVG